MVPSGLAFVEEALEAERTALCGPRYAHGAGREAICACHGRIRSPARPRAEVKRPRLRSIDDHEFALPSWQTWSSRDPLHERAVEQMVLGVSTRRYARSLEPLSELRVHGVSKSAVSERFVAGTAPKLARSVVRQGLSLGGAMGSLVSGAP